MSDPAPLRLRLITDGKAGDLAQVMGVAEAVAAVMMAEAEVAETVAAEQRGVAVGAGAAPLLTTDPTIRPKAEPAFQRGFRVIRAGPGSIPGSRASFVRHFRFSFGLRLIV